MKKEQGFVAISAIWYERYLECSRTCMTDEFPKSVWRFYHSLLNLDDSDLAIKDKIKTFVEDVWQPKIDKLLRENTEHTNDSDTIAIEKEIIEARYIHEVFDKIIQLIQDSGIGWPTHHDVDQYFISQ